MLSHWLISAASCHAILARTAVSPASFGQTIKAQTSKERSELIKRSTKAVRKAVSLKRSRVSHANLNGKFKIRFKNNQRYVDGR